MKRIKSIDLINFVSRINVITNKKERKIQYPPRQISTSKEQQIVFILTYIFHFDVFSRKAVLCFIKKQGNLFFIDGSSS